MLNYYEIGQRIRKFRKDDLLFDNMAVTRNSVIDDLTNLLENCSTLQIKILKDIVKAAKTSMDKHL